jgi:hypothetical protein
MEIVGARGAEFIIRELDTVETFSELFNKYPQLLQNYPALSQFYYLPYSPPVLEPPRPDSQRNSANNNAHPS